MKLITEQNILMLISRKCVSHLFRVWIIWYVRCYVINVYVTRRACTTTSGTWGARTGDVIIIAV